MASPEGLVAGEAAGGKAWLEAFIMRKTVPSAGSVQEGGIHQTSGTGPHRTPSLSLWCQYRTPMLSSFLPSEGITGCGREINWGRKETEAKWKDRRRSCGPTFVGSLDLVETSTEASYFPMEKTSEEPKCSLTRQWQTLLLMPIPGWECFV